MNNYEIDGNPHEKHPDRNRKLIDALHYLDNYLACIFKVTVDVKQNNIGEVTYYTYRSFLNLCNPKSDDPYVDRFLLDKIMTGYAGYQDSVRQLLKKTGLRTIRKRSGTNWERDVF